MSPIYGRITIIKPNNEFGGVYEMDKRTCLIGRSPTCNIRKKSNAVEKEHCAVEFNHNGQAFFNCQNLASHRAVRIFDRRVPNISPPSAHTVDCAEISWLCRRCSLQPGHTPVHGINTQQPSTESKAVNNGRMHRLFRHCQTHTVADERENSREPPKAQLGAMSTWSEASTTAMTSSSTIDDFSSVACTPDLPLKSTALPKQVLEDYPLMPLTVLQKRFSSGTPLCVSSRQYGNQRPACDILVNLDKTYNGLEQLFASSSPLIGTPNRHSPAKIFKNIIPKMEDTSNDIYGSAIKSNQRVTAPCFLRETFEESEEKTDTLNESTSESIEAIGLVSDSDTTETELEKEQERSRC
ncbi:unnamed protein product [Soboliphyme baturini]|uniref:FHA domain-containing protein n=1 Tax=Soboliphyme baturini TaxID=241478 RepID=A0A183II15_9BILA|nr:unnamed protein product [Soboliphyme baturini]